jgi:dihydroxyacid dehydratase/phosphogluconate dehydratase
VQFGLARGSADLIGYRTITITPDMVGQQVAVFTSIEVKTPTGRIRPEQRAWMETVQAAGGIAGVARSVEDAKALLAAQPDGVPGASHKQSAE